MTPIEKIINCDPSVFTLHSATSEGDRCTLLQLQNIVRQVPYSYLELGCYKGGSLVPHLHDPQCFSVVAADSRPGPVWDERGRMFHDEVTTEQMLEHLRTVIKPADMMKLKAVEADSEHVIEHLDPLKEPTFTLAFIDAEHTNVAVFQDFLFVDELMAPDSIVAFHDSNLVFDALWNIDAMLRAHGRHYNLRYLKDNVCAIGFGAFASSSAFRALPHADPVRFLTVARAKLWDEISFNSAGRR